MAIIRNTNIPQRRQKLQGFDLMRQRIICVTNPTNLRSGQTLSIF